MTLDEYQAKAITTAVDTGKDEKALIARLLGLIGEAGEIAEKFKKIYRDNNGEYTEEDLAEIRKEIGDVLWYVAAFSDYFEFKLGDIAAENIKKLADRKQRGKLSGSGDNR